MQKKAYKEKQNAEILANLIFNILPKCQQKEVWLAGKSNLLHAEFKCLHFFESDKKLNNKYIAEKLNISQSRSTRIIDGLVKKGYLSREENSADRRNIEVTLLKKGKILTNNLDKDYINLHRRILQEINPSQHDTLIAAMENLNSAIQMWLQKPKLSYLSERKSLKKEKSVSSRQFTS